MYRCLRWHGLCEWISGIIGEKGLSGMRRICIYLTYDKQNIVDRYIGYMLKELKTCVDHLVVIVNETEVTRGKANLETSADAIFYRKNIGFDAGGFKDALCDLIGWNKILQYDELILVNDSMFGPFKPMKQIFEEMDQKCVDFWGLIKSAEQINENLGHIQEHIQSFFLVVRSKLLHSYDFRVYWEEMRYFGAFEEVIKEHEIKFTQYFSGKGYTYDALANTEVNDSSIIENNYCQYSRISLELIKKRNFPFLKKQQICLDALGGLARENMKAIDYIGMNTMYDIDLIWENIIRTLNITDLYRNLHLNYIIPLNTRTETYDNVMIIVFILYRDSEEYVEEYLSKINPQYRIKVFVKSDDLLTSYTEMGFEAEVADYEKVIKTLTESAASDYVCFLRDTDLTSEIRPNYEGKSYFYSIWENLIKNNEHIAGIISKFQENPRLGLLAPPIPNFDDHFGTCGNTWNGNFEEVLEAVKKIPLKCQISEHLGPFRITDSFWIRGCILNKLKRTQKEYYKYLPYMWSYFAQDAGYFSGVVESMEYASINEVNMQSYLNVIIDQNKQYFGEFQTFRQMKEQLGRNIICEFSEKYSRILIYGAGGMAKRYRRFLPNVEAYVVSDGRSKPEEISGVPVKYLSEIEDIKKCGFVICLNKKNQLQVIPILQKCGIENYICI